MSLQATLIICGVTVVVSILGLLGLWFPHILVISLLLLGVSGCVFIIHVSRFQFSLQKTDYFHTLTSLLLIFIVLFHAIHVFVPETGFDALWYHLPLIQRYADHHQLTYEVDFYQSLYPQFADGVLLLGYSAFGVIGAKSVTYLFFLLLLASSYQWLRSKLSSNDALTGTLVLSLFQVVGWQASSVYVDLISSVFFLWASFELVLGHAFCKWDKHFFIACISAGVFFGSKFINLGFIPLFLFLTVVTLFGYTSEQSMRSRLTRLFVYWGVVISLVLPWHVRAWWMSGIWLFPIGTVYAVPVISQMGVTGWTEWFALRWGTVWRLPIDFFVHNDGYVSPLLLFFFPLALTQKTRSFATFLGIIIGLYGLFFWYFFPPPSTRYVLGLVIVFWIVVWQQTVLYAKSRPKVLFFVRALAVLNVTVFLLIRVFISTRTIPYLLGAESQQQYLSRFKNGFLDEKLDQFYSHFIIPHQ